MSWPIGSWRAGTSAWDQTTVRAALSRCHYPCDQPASLPEPTGPWDADDSVAAFPGTYQFSARPGTDVWASLTDTSSCLCDDDGAIVAHEGQLVGAANFQEFLDGANNRGNAHTRRLVWDAYAENTSGRRLL